MDESFFSNDRGINWGNGSAGPSGGELEIKLTIAFHATFGVLGIALNRHLDGQMNLFGA